MDIGIDFDGTCVTHEYPFIGLDIGAIPVLQRLMRSGHRLILTTMRSNLSEPKVKGGIVTPAGDYLTMAVDYLEERDIILFGVNKHPEQEYWTDSNKPYAELYIDDAALGVPLKFNPAFSSRPYVDWELVEVLLEDMELI